MPSRVPIQACRPRAIVVGASNDARLPPSALALKGGTPPPPAKVKASLVSNPFAGLAPSSLFPSLCPVREEKPFERAAARTGGTTV